MKRRPQTFTTFSSHLSSIWHILQLEVGVSDPESYHEAKKTLGISSAEFLIQVILE